MSESEKKKRKRDDNDREIVLKYFNYDNETKTNKCLVENCNKTLKANFVFNLKRH